MLALPALSGVSNPRLPPAFDTAATSDALDAQVTSAVRSRVVLSLYNPVALRLVLKPTSTVGENGVIWIAVSVAWVTVSKVEPVIPAKEALMVVLPSARAWACPLEPLAVLIAATVGVDEVHVACPVTFCVLLSL